VGDLKLSTFTKGKSKQQALAFYKIVCAVYSVPDKLTNAKELPTLTVLAQFYIALPVLSRSLSYTLLPSKAFISKMESNASDLLVAIKQLRHAELFKDYLLLSLGPWHFPFSPKSKDPGLKQMAITARGRIRSTLFEA
jgi:hypothetical protein